jgi:predicted phage gp36 major capsid-like protein
MGELYANPAASQAMLDDAAFDLESWLANEIAVEFARAEGSAFVNGTGTNQPQGLPGRGDQQRGGHRPSVRHAAVHSPAAMPRRLTRRPELKLIDMVHSLKAAHRQGAVFVMNSKPRWRTMRKLKAADGSFLWQPGMMPMARRPACSAIRWSRPRTCPMSRPMPSRSLSATSSAGYLIAERRATTILRDPFTNKPFVNFYATKRIGGQVLDSEAIKLLKVSV